MCGILGSCGLPLTPLHLESLNLAVRMDPAWSRSTLPMEWYSSVIPDLPYSTFPSPAINPCKAAMDAGG